MTIFAKRPERADSDDLCRSNAVEPAHQHRDRPRVMAQAVAVSGQQRQLGWSVRLGGSAGIRSRDAHIVVVAVHHEQRVRCESSGGGRGPEAAERPLQVVHGPWVSRVRMTPNLDHLGIVNSPCPGCESAAIGHGQVTRS